MSQEVKSVSEKRDKEYSDYYSKVKFSDKEKKDIETVLDSWYGAPLTNDSREYYEQDVYDLIQNKLLDDRPDNVRKVDSEYYSRSKEYWSACDKLTNDIVKEYSQTMIYTRDKGINGDHKMYGENYIKKLINEKNVIGLLGGYEKGEKTSNGTIYTLIGAAKYTEHHADYEFDAAVSRLAEEFNADWYNKQKSK